MAFFEDLGKKITQTSQGVVQKTKDTAGFDYGTYYAATLTVKPHNMVKEEIQVRFYNSGDTDKVSSIVVFFTTRIAKTKKLVEMLLLKLLK